MAGIGSRTKYTRSALDSADLEPCPIRKFLRWHDEAVTAALAEPHAMTLATAAPDGAPSARVVLLRQVDERGFASFTSFESRKGRELEVSPRAALVFYWAELERQVRVEGRVGRVSEAESDVYFAGRPVGSRLGAWASPQGAVVPDHAAFEGRIEGLARRLAGGAVPRPPS